MIYVYMQDGMYLTHVLSQTSDQFRWANLYGFNAYAYVISHNNVCRFHLLV